MVRGQVVTVTPNEIPSEQSRDHLPHALKLQPQSKPRERVRLKSLERVSGPGAVWPSGGQIHARERYSRAAS